MRGGYWFPGAKTCSCAAHFAYRATVGSKMKCKMNERCYKKLEMHYRGRGRWVGGAVVHVMKIPQSLITTDDIRNGAQRVEVFS